MPEIGQHLIFKGGTSLSKAYKVIERFSEDIDISIDKKYLGANGESDPEIAPSKKKQQALIKKLSATCKSFVQTELIHKLKQTFSQSLGSTNSPWSIEVDTTDVDGQSILFYYPSQKKNTLNSYIKPAVKIELGARGAGNPTNLCPITPFIEELIPDILTEKSVQIKTLAAQRTFWEKATILHMYSHWPENKILPERQSRHFFDFYKLIQSDIKNLAISAPKLLTRVAEHKKIYYRAGWANYDSAAKGTLCLTSNQTVLKILEKDYKKMHAMFYGNEVKWGIIISGIKNFENEFNNPL